MTGPLGRSGPQVLCRGVGAMTCSVHCPSAGGARFTGRTDPLSRFTGGDIEGPRCPEVPGCFPGALPGWPPPRAGRARGAARGVRPGKIENVSVFNDFWSFGANFICLFVSDFAWFGSAFPTSFQISPGVCLHLGRPGVSPGVIATSGTPPAGHPEVRPSPPPARGRRASHIRSHQHTPTPVRF